MPFYSFAFMTFKAANGDILRVRRIPEVEVDPRLAGIGVETQGEELGRHGAEIDLGR